MPSSSDKQRRFMGAELARKRAGKKTQTGMSENQLRDFAGSVGSLEDIDYHEDAAGKDSLKLSGFYYDPGEECHDAQKNHEFMSSWESREVKNGPDYKLEIDYFGPDTDYRAEEINPHHYGRDYEPAPFKDLFKTEEKAERVGLRMREEYEYSEVSTPGTVPDKGMDTSLAYGSVSYEKIPTENPDSRGFGAQKKFRRAQDEVEEDAVKVSKLDTKRGKNIR